MAKNKNKGQRNKGAKDPQTSTGPVTPFEDGQPVHPPTYNGEPAPTTPGSGDTVSAQPKPDPTADQIRAQLDAATQYGDSLVGKYIAPDAFAHINAASTPEMLAFLDTLKQQMGTAGQLTDLEKQAIAESQKGLAGYSSPEMQAFREAALQEINRDYMNRQRANMANAARFGIRGAAAGAQMQDAATDNTMARGNLERDLFVKNADYMERARSAFGNLVNQTEAARFGRQDQSAKNYGTALSGEEQARTGREMFNANQDTNKAVTGAGLALSGAGLWAGQYGNQQAQDEARRQFDAWMEQQKLAQADSNRFLDNYMKKTNKGINDVSSNI